MDDARARVAGLVLAAGGGRRIGGPKALLPVGGRLLVERAVETVVAAGCLPVVVLGAAAGEVRASATWPAGVRIVVNDEWASGMASSLRAGFTACADAAAVVVVLVDQPGVTAAVIARLVAAWRSGSAPAVVACYDGAPRNPVLFEARLLDDVAATLSGDEGARRWLRAHRGLVADVEVGDVGDWADVDTPADLAAVTQPAGKRAHPAQQPPSRRP